MLNRTSHALLQTLCISTCALKATSYSRVVGKLAHPTRASIFRPCLLPQPHSALVRRRPFSQTPYSKRHTPWNSQFHKAFPAGGALPQSTLSSAPVLPLSERPVQARVSADDLFAWHATAIAQADAVGSAFADADGGPSSEDLKIELNWLLDDTVDAVQVTADGQWKPCTWRQLQSQVHHPADTSNASPQSIALRADIRTLAQLWKQRTQGRVPLQYLNNCCHWRDFILAVGDGVLIPRPETEILIDLAEQAMQKRTELKQGVWLDLGTGSGAIAIALATLLLDSTQIYAVDESPEAVAWAKLNVQRLGLTDRIQVKTGSWYEPVQTMCGNIAGIVSNPPYIPHSQMSHLQAEVRQYEPWLALDGGQGPGLDSLNLICQGASVMLQPGGFLALETTGGTQAQQVIDMLQQMQAFDHIQSVQDLAGVSRFVTAWKALDK
ncbi:TPA: hypothetical protein ACH3X2_000042 [Trebouxia sp. C0005]